MQRIGALAGFLVLIASFVPTPALALRCSDGSESHTATAQEAAAAPNGAIIAGTTQVCPGDAQSGIDAQAGQAKNDLASLRCNTGVDIAHLDGKFAVCADKFMQQLRQTSSRACIRSAYRSEAQQAAACKNICGQLSCPGLCAPPGRSYHQKGLAIDVDGVANNAQSWQIAAQFGVVNPGGLHRSDPNHYQSGNTDCAGMPVPAGDQGDYYNDTEHFFPAPSLPFQNMLGSLLRGGQQAPQPAQQTPPNPIPQLPVSSSTLISSMLSGSTTPIGAGSTTNTLPMTDPFTGMQQTPVSGQLGGQPTGGSNPNPYDLLNALAYSGATSTTIATGAPLALNSNLYQAGSVQYDQNGRPLPQVVPGSVSPQGPGSSQTFTSQDLQYQDTGWTPPSNATLLQKTLASLQQALYQVLVWARPFGNLAPPPGAIGT